MGMRNFTTTETQLIEVTFQVDAPITFPDQYESADDFADRIAEVVADSCDGEVVEYFVNEFDFDDDGLVPEETYTLSVGCRVSISGTCDYDGGRTYGDPYYCYPESIDDVEYEEGMIDSCDTSKVIAVFPELLNLTAKVGEVSTDGDIELSDDEPDYDYYDDRYDF